jgi:hypothetical protein
LLCGGGGLLVFGVLLGSTIAQWKAFVETDDAWRRDLCVYLFVLWIFMYCVRPLFSFLALLCHRLTSNYAQSGFFLSWASYQAFMQVEGGTGLLSSTSGRRFNFFSTISPFVENVLFVGGGIVSVVFWTVRTPPSHFRLLFLTFSPLETTVLSANRLSQSSAA